MLIHISTNPDLDDGECALTNKKNRVEKNIKVLEQSLGYSFKHPALLEKALTHCSASADNNERFEFLGDSLVNLILAQALYEQFPKAAEGELTRLRAICVRGETLAKIAAAHQLGDYLKLGAGELRSGGAFRPSIIADALEAVIAAIYLDSDFHQVQSSVLVWFKSLLETLSLDMMQKDPKTQLQEFLQSKKLELPAYTVIAIEGESHEQQFKVSCLVQGREQPAIGVGPSRRKAEQEAARTMLEMLKHEH